MFAGGGNHDPMVCPYFLNTYIYNPARENHQNSLWSNNHHVIERQHFVSQEKKSSLKETMESLNRTFKSFMKFSLSLESYSKVDHEEHEEDKENTEEQWEYFINYYEKYIAGQHVQEIETTEQKEKDAGTCSKNFYNRRDKSSAEQPNFWLDSRPPIESELLFVPKHPSDPPARSEEPEVEKIVFKARVPFERKKLDLSSYTFDETPIE